MSVGMGGCGQHPDLPAPGSLQLLNGQLYTMVLVEMPPPSTVRTLFLRPDALSLLHEGLASQACGNKGPMEDVVCWLGQLFLLYSHGHYRLGKEGFSALLTQVPTTPHTHKGQDLELQRQTVIGIALVCVCADVPPSQCGWCVVPVWVEQQLRV